MSRRLLAAIALALMIAGCGGPVPEAPSPTSSPVDNRCAQLSQEVLDAYNRGDTAAEKAAGDEFDRLAEAGQCD